MDIARVNFHSDGSCRAQVLTMVKVKEDERLLITVLQTLKRALYSWLSSDALLDHKIWVLI